MINGIDVSAYETPSAWAGLAVDFVLAKASEGQHGRDPEFAAHAYAATSRKLPFGAYHFGWPVNGATADAANYLAAVAGRHGIAHVLDLEPYNDRRNVGHLSAGAIRDYATAWVAAVKHARPGEKVGIYADTSTFDAGWVPKGADFYWVAQYPLPQLDYNGARAHRWPQLPAGYGNASIWQFADGPRMDRDVAAFADRAALARWIAPSPVHAPQGKTYTVAKGDTLSGIAARFHVTLSALEHANPQIHNVNVIYPGEAVHIPAAA